MARNSRPNSYTGIKANQSKSGQSRFATVAEAIAGAAPDLVISPLTLDAAADVLVQHATTLLYGTVTLTDNSAPIATKLYADNLAIAGSPVSSETTAGIGQLSTDAEAVSGTPSTGTVAL